MLFKEINNWNFNQYLSDNWGIWSKEKYLCSKSQNEAKRDKEKAIIKELMATAPTRLQYGLNFSYGISNLDAYAQPLTKEEYVSLANIYSEGISYTAEIKNDALRFLCSELYFINKTMVSIPGFSELNLVNEANDPVLHRKYFYVDFFKFSCINALMRMSKEEIAELPPDWLSALLILSYFLGTGCFLYRSASFFSAHDFDQLKQKLEKLRERIEIHLEFPEYHHSKYEMEFHQLSDFIVTNKLTNDNQVAIRRWDILDTCNQYYKTYLDTAYQFKQIKKPLKALEKMFKAIVLDKTVGAVDIHALKSELRNLRENLVNKHYAPLSANEIFVTDYNSVTNHPYFQGLYFEANILSELFGAEHPNDKNTEVIKVVFKELLPFYSASSKGDIPFIFPFNPFLDNNDIPNAVIAHHVHNANTKKLHDMMAINQMAGWPDEKLLLNISSSSSNPNAVREERRLCLEFGFNHYRIHARQHLKAGNQNRTIFNAINQSGIEYYLTLDDDYFIFPDYLAMGHTIIQKENLDFYQSPLAFKGVYIHTKIAERADADIIHYFESTSGYNDMNMYTFPRGTNTIFQFVDGNGSLSDTGGFLVDYSAEDFGQGYIALFQQLGDDMGHKTHDRNPGKISKTIKVIGEGVDLAGKLKQANRWNHGASKLFVHLFLPVFIKNILKGNMDFIKNKNVINLFLMAPLAITSRLMTLVLFCLPAVFYLLITYNIVPSVSSLVKSNALLISCITCMLIGILHYSYHFKRISFAAIRITILDLIVTVPSAIGYLKGIYGNTPQTWSSNKSKRLKNNHLLLPMFVILTNALAAILIYDVIKSVAFWAIFNAVLLLFGIIYCNSYRATSEIRWSISKKTLNFIYIGLMVIFLFFTGMYYYIAIPLANSFLDWAIILLLSILFLILIRNLIFSFIMSNIKLYDTHLSYFKENIQRVFNKKV